MSSGDYYLALRQPENPAASSADLNYTYYENGFDLLPSFAGLMTVKTGVVNNFLLSVADRTSTINVSSFEATDTGETLTVRWGRGAGETLQAIPDSVLLR